MPSNLIPHDLLRRAAERFRLLGEPVRLQLLNALMVDGEQHVSALAEATGQSHANVSKHLRLMQDAGMLRCRREGNRVVYALDDPSLPGLCLLVCGQLQREAV